MTPTLITLMETTPLLLLLPLSALEALQDTPDTKEERGSCSNPTGTRAFEGICDSFKSACRTALIRAIEGVTKALALVASKRPKTTLPATVMAPV